MVALVIALVAMVIALVGELATASPRPGRHGLALVALVWSSPWSGLALVGMASPWSPSPWSAWHGLALVIALVGMASP
jgi:hypothetical protein